jgi:hypothetical protein
MRLTRRDIAALSHRNRHRGIDAKVIASWNLALRRGLLIALSRLRWWSPFVLKHLIHTLRLGSEMARCETDCHQYGVEPGH